MVKMKKILSIFVAAIMAVCMCSSLAACGDDKPEKPEMPRKRIAGIDSDKTYVKGKFYIEDQIALHEKTMYLEVLSYDKIEKEELENITFDISRLYNDPIFGNGPQETVTELKANNFKLLDGSKHSNGYYHYYVYMYLTADKVMDGFKIDSINMTISGKEYKFSSEILIQVYTNFVYVYPNTFGNTVGDPVKGADSVLINTRYDMTLKSLKFQTEGYEIISYYAEKFEGYTSEGKPKGGEKVSETLPIELKANQTYQIFVEAVAPDDCLYYGYDFEAVVEIQGVEMMYTNYAMLDTYSFKGSAISIEVEE